mgnify:FL=1
MHKEKRDMEMDTYRLKTPLALLIPLNFIYKIQFLIFIVRLT